MNTNSILGVIVGIALVTALVLQQVEALAEGHESSTKVPSAMSGDNIYIAWWTNKTGNDEVMFRVSNDAGGTF
jgi:archaellin